MFRNYFVTAIRNINRNRLFSFITIFGLAAGLTCALLISVFIIDEYSYDKFHSKADRIYRVRYKIQDFDIARIPPIIKENLESFFPEIESSSRFFSRAVSVKVQNPQNGEIKRFEEENVQFSLLFKPENNQLQEKLKLVRSQNRTGQPTVPSSLSEEKQINPFLLAEDWQALASLRSNKDVY